MRRSPVYSSSIAPDLFVSGEGLCWVFPDVSPSLISYSQGDSDTDSEVEDRVDGVKSWLSKNKSSAKNLSDDGSLKSSRFVPTKEPTRKGLMPP